MAISAAQTTLTDEQIIHRATRAKALLTDEILREAFETAEKTCIGEWILADTPQKREALHAQLLGLRRIVMQLRKLIGDGTYAEQMAKKAASRKAGLDADTIEKEK